MQDVDHEATKETVLKKLINTMREYFRKKWKTVLIKKSRMDSEDV